ncbi:hypothetical protein GCM10010448_49130 [Streptomyces glomeratus]|uniref:DUF2474 domain-containing protein n=1 Tax=Streptomyces glomeratus TaxID=284452 RepID=A0ABP6LTD6_9ACTN
MIELRERWENRASDTARTATRDDPLMRIRREVRWVLWGLWLACLVFSAGFIVWFCAEVIKLFLEAESW